MKVVTHVVMESAGLKTPRKKWKRIGYRLEITDYSHSTINGVGIGKTSGKYALPFGVQAMNSGMKIPGVLESYSIADSSTPLLLSQAVQAKLGFMKNVRNGTIELLDYEGQSLKVVRQKRTGLFMIRVDHLNPNTLVTHPGEVPIGLFNARFAK